MFKFFKKIFKKTDSETIVPIAQKKCLYLMVGAPGSGKSTYCKNNAVTDNDIVISRDEIRNRLLTNEATAYQVWVHEIQCALDDTFGPKNVYADATHLTVGSRVKLLSRLNLENVENITALVLRPSLVETLRRNNQRSERQVVPNRIVRRMYNSFQRPELDTQYSINAIYLEVPK